MAGHPSGARRGGAAFAVVLALVGLCSTACSSAKSDSNAIAVVTSTDVYADLVRQVAGQLAKGAHPAVTVTAIIDNPAVDPHSYEANTRTQLAISRADLIVENGGGYDSFVDNLRASNSSATVINVVQLAGARAISSGGPNEHVWYDLPTVLQLVLRITKELSDRDRRDSGIFAANAREVVANITFLENTEATIKSRAGGTPVAVTEPVAIHLLDACGLVNRTPAQFSKAVEEGTDVAPRVLADTLALFRAHQVRLLVYNSQTTGAETDQVRAAAHSAGIPEIAVTETLPPGRDYLSWMTELLTQVRAKVES